MEREADALAAGLADPARPTICPACVSSFRAHLEPGVIKANMRTLRKSHHDMWDRIMRFLTLSRTPKSRAELSASLASRLRTCRSPYRERKEHQEAVTVLALGDESALTIPGTRLSNTAEHVISTLCDYLRKCFEDAHKSIILAQRFSVRRGLWPSSADDLLPFGPEKSFASLLYWFMSAEDAQTFSAFYVLIWVCEDQLLPLLMREPDRLAFVKSICTHINAAVAYAHWTRSKGFADRASRIGHESRIVSLVHIIDLLVALVRRMDPNQTRRSACAGLIRGCEVDLLECLKASIPVVSNEQERAQLAELTDSVCDVLGTPEELRPQVLQNQFSTIARASGDSYVLLRSSIIRQREIRICGHPDCGKSERDLGRRLSMCSGCSVLWYCSKDCQKRHWKMVGRPHKAVCERIKMVVPLIDQYPDNDEFSRKARASNITSADVARIIDSFNTIKGLESLSPEESVKNLTAVMKLFDITYTGASDISRSQDLGLLQNFYSLVQDPVLLETLKSMLAL